MDNRPSSSGIEPGVADHDLWNVVCNLDLPLALVDLRSNTVTAATDTFLDQLGVSAGELLGNRLADLFEESDRKRGVHALEALASGAIELYRAHRVLTKEKFSGRAISVWVRAIDFDDERLALVEIRSTQERIDSPLAEHLGFAPIKMAIGFTDADGIITAVSSDIEDVTGVPATLVMGRPLLSAETQEEITNDLGVSHPREGRRSLSLAITSSETFGPECHICCGLTSLVGSSSQCFILTQTPVEPLSDLRDRTAQLEERLRKIASEVRASGVFDGMENFPNVARFPQMASLTTRQWEVLNRLLRGERVPTIASALYLSPSTVRNNLSALFHKFGVHSQAELLALLRG